MTTADPTGESSASSFPQVRESSVVYDATRLDSGLCGRDTASALLEHYERTAEAPDAIEHLRRFVLNLAVCGKLLPQESTDEPASDLLCRIESAKKKLVQAGEIRKPRDFGQDGSVLAPFDIPASWKWIRLDSVGAIVGGGTPSATDSENFAEPGTGIPWLTPADLGGHEGLFVCRGARDISEKGLRSSSATLMPAGSVLFTSRAPIGYVAIAANPISTNQGFKSIVPYIADCSRFIATTMKAFAPDIDAKAPGTTFKEVSGKLVAAIPFPLPPLAEQHRIVAKVDELMALCDRLEAARAQREATRDRLTVATLARLNRTEPAASTDDEAPKASSVQSHARFALDALSALTARPDQIKQLRRAIQHHAVLGNLTKQDASEDRSNQRLLRSDSDAESFDLSAFEARASEFSLPPTWAIEPLSRVAAHIVDCPHTTPVWTDAGVLCVRTNQVRAGSLDLSASRFVSEETYALRIERLTPRADDILYIREGGVLGVGCRIPSGLRLCMGQRLMLIRSNAVVSAKYLELCLNSPWISDFASKMTTGGAAPRVNMSVVRAYPVPVPPFAEQHRIVAKVDELMALCDQLEASLRRGESTRSRLLDALLHEALAPTASTLEAA